MQRTGLVRGRVIVLTLLLAVAFTSATIWAALLRHEILGVGYLPRWVVSFFVVLVGINAVIKRFSPQLSLTSTELAFIFAVLSVIASIPHEIGIHFYLNLLGLVYYSSPYSQWFGQFTPHLPEYLVPSTNFRDPVILWAYEGMPEGAKLPLAEWFVPLIAWTPYIFGVYLVLVFLCLLLARQWEEHERLLYPLAQVPMELSGATQERSAQSIFRSPLFWVGFIVATLPYSLRGLHLYFPFIPDPQPQRNSGVLFASGPLTAFNNIDLHLYPEMVGIAYFLSHEVGLSLWLFPFLRRAEVALRMAIGIDMYHAEFLTFQSVSAYLVMAGSLLWLARGYLKEVGLTALKWILRKVPLNETDDSNVPLTEAKALVGFVLAFAALLLWAKFVAGVGLIWTGLLLLGLVITGLVVARIVGEAGVYIFAPPFRAYQVIFDIFGKDRLGAKKHRPSLGDGLDSNPKHWDDGYRLHSQLVAPLLFLRGEQGFWDWLVALRHLLDNPCLPHCLPDSDLHLRRPEVELVGTNFIAQHGKLRRSVSHDIPPLDTTPLVGLGHWSDNLLGAHQTSAQLRRLPSSSNRLRDLVWLAT